MQAWAFEAASCPIRPNEVKKTKLQNNTSPQACISIVLCAGWVCLPFYISTALPLSRRPFSSASRCQNECRPHASCPRRQKVSSCFQILRVTNFSKSQKMDSIHCQSKCRRANSCLPKLNSQLLPNSQRWSFNLSTKTSQSQSTKIFFKKSDSRSKGRQVVNEARSCISAPCTQRLCLRSGGTLKRFTVPRDQTLNEDINL